MPRRKERDQRVRQVRWRDERRVAEPENSVTRDAYQECHRIRLFLQLGSGATRTEARTGEERAYAKLTLTLYRWR